MPPPYLFRTERDSVPETFSFFEYKAMGRVQLIPEYENSSRDSLSPPPIYSASNPTVLWVASLRTKQLKHVGHHSLPSGAEIKNSWSFTFNSPMLFLHVILGSRETLL